MTGRPHLRARLTPLSRSSAIWRSSAAYRKACWRPEGPDIDTGPRRRRQNRRGLCDGISVAQARAAETQRPGRRSGRHGLRVVAQAIPACGIGRTLGDDDLFGMAVAQAPGDGLDGGAFGNRPRMPPDDFVLCGTVFGPGVFTFVSASAWRRCRDRGMLSSIGSPARPCVGSAAARPVTISRRSPSRTRSSSRRSAPVGDRSRGRRRKNPGCVNSLPAGGYGPRPSALQSSTRRPPFRAPVSASARNPRTASASGGLIDPSTPPPASYVSPQTASCTGSDR